MRLPQDARRRAKHIGCAATVLNRRLSLAVSVLVLAGAIALSLALGSSHTVSAAPSARWCPLPEGAPHWARSLRMTVLVDSVLLSGKPAIKRAHRCYRIGWRGRPASPGRIRPDVRARAQGPWFRSNREGPCFALSASAAGLIPEIMQ